MTINELKFTQAELDAKSITALADRPALSAAELKERLDSCDIRLRLNGLIDGLSRVMVFAETNTAAVVEAVAIHGEEGRFFALFLDSGRIFCGNAAELTEWL